MNYVWGSLLILIGLFFMISAFMKSEFIVYKMLTARSRLLWKDKVHNFYKVVGAIIIIVGILFMLNIGINA
jgi:uncharacterized membrane protein